MHFRSMALLHDVERGEFYIESKGSVSTLSHDVEIDGIDFYVFIEMLYFFVSYSIFGYHAAVWLYTVFSREKSRWASSRQGTIFICLFCLVK